MPALAAGFRRTVRAATELPEAGEVIRDWSEQGSVPYRELTPPRLMALYEMAYLRIFVAWENFLEDTLLRTMCGYISPLYIPRFQEELARERSVKEAYKALLRPGQNYLLWHNPKEVERRAKEWVVGSPHEVVIASSLARLEWFSWVRHRVAHGSDDARAKMDRATLGLAGRQFAGASVGRFLRSWNQAAQPQVRWIYTIADELGALSSQMAP
jgi:hypothetical protein